ncbi:kynureninase [Hyphomicrobiaceae bacterium 22]|uniref:Kynureninase n=1 Tax=Prosthecodimorpha staleyi TaxID=2840188 RepID=A0A947DB88_9HYPH|nr:kynureninase [Prosthecodimorpha staleyi]
MQRAVSRRRVAATGRYGRGTIGIFQSSNVVGSARHCRPSARWAARRARNFRRSGSVLPQPIRRPRVTALTRQDCLALDAADPLASLRDRFDLPEGVIYLDGNSLGALPKGVAERVEQVVRLEWGRDLIRSWNTADWYGAPGRVGAKLAPLLGARPNEVTITDTISVNLYKLLVAAVRMRPGRSRILCEAGNFPSDNHIVDSVARQFGLEVVAVPAGEIAAAVDGTVAVATLSHVNYRSALMQDMGAVTEAIHRAGALAVWDLAHSSGAVRLDLDGTGADFAVGCGYKYLNGGPGAPSHIFVAERHQAAFDQPLTGWFAHAAPFRFDPGFARADGIRAALCSTPQMLSLIALEAALDAFAGVDMGALEAKGRALGDLLIRFHDERLARFGSAVASPRETARRGSHVSIALDGGFPVMARLIERGIIGDFRAPDILRFGFAPLYLRFVDIYDAAEALEAILAADDWRDAPVATGAVT